MRFKVRRRRVRLRWVRPSSTRRRCRKRRFSKALAATPAKYVEVAELLKKAGAKPDRE